MFACGSVSSSSEYDSVGCRRHNGQESLFSINGGEFLNREGRKSIFEEATCNTDSGIF
jgi:hypothetical protein